MPGTTRRSSTIRQRHTRQTWINLAGITLALILFFGIIFGTWWLMMPAPAAHIDPLPWHNDLQETADRLERDVQALAADIGERNLHRPGTMDAAVRFLEDQLSETGRSVGFHSYELRRGRYAGHTSLNLYIEIPGTDQPETILIVGSHYDAVLNSPGANDNASGMAVLLELARIFADRPQPVTVRFVAFANEEPPFFQTEDMGSYAYAERSRSLGEEIRAAMILDGLGYFSDEPGSQVYPLPGFSGLYSDRADFIGFVTRLRDLGLLRKATKGFRSHDLFPVQAAALPGFIPGVNWSDHWSFWQHGYSAFLVTDTLPFRDPDYHSAADTPERLNYRHMARITHALAETIETLSEP